MTLISMMQRGDTLYNLEMCSTIRVNEGQDYLKENQDKITTSSSDGNGYAMNSETAVEFFKSIQLDHGTEKNNGNGTGMKVYVLEAQIEIIEEKLKDLKLTPFQLGSQLAQDREIRKEEIAAYKQQLGLLQTFLAANTNGDDMVSLEEVNASMDSCDEFNFTDSDIYFTDFEDFCKKNNIDVPKSKPLSPSKDFEDFCKKNNIDVHKGKPLSMSFNFMT